MPSFAVFLCLWESVKAEGYRGSHFPGLPHACPILLVGPVIPHISHIPT